MQTVQKSAWIQRCIAVLGMAMMWPFIHNQLMFPVTFVYNKPEAPSVLVLYLIYAMVFIATCAFIAVSNRRLIQKLYANCVLMAAIGIAAAIGVLLLCYAGFGTLAAYVASVVGIVLVAVFVPLYFVFWCERITELGEGSLAQGHIVAIACAVSYLVFCVITGIRLSLGLHASYFTIVYVVLTTIMAVASLVTSRVSADLSTSEGKPQTQTPTGDATLQQLPLNVVIASTAFVLLSTCVISLLNPAVAATDYPASRAFLYWLDAALTIVISIIYFANRGTSRRAHIIIFTVLSIYLVGMILATALSVMQDFRTANFAIIAGKNSFDLFVLIVVLTSANNKHVLPTRLVVLYLALIVELTQLLSALILMLGGSFKDELGNNMVLGVMLVFAFAVTAVADIILMLFLTRQQRTAARVNRESEQKQSQGVELPSNQWIGVVNNDAIFEQARTAWHLTDRELDILRAVCSNASTQKIAREYGISEATVYSHLKRIYQKSGVHSRQELIDLVETLGK